MIEESIKENNSNELSVVENGSYKEKLLSREDFFKTLEIISCAEDNK